MNTHTTYTHKSTIVVFFRNHTYIIIFIFLSRTITMTSDNSDIFSLLLESLLFEIITILLLAAAVCILNKNWLRI